MDMVTSYDQSCKKMLIESREGCKVRLMDVNWCWKWSPIKAVNGCRCRLERSRIETRKKSLIQAWNGCQQRVEMVVDWSWNWSSTEAGIGRPLRLELVVHWSWNWSLTKAGIGRQLRLKLVVNWCWNWSSSEAGIDRQPQGIPMGKLLKLFKNLKFLVSCLSYVDSPLEVIAN